MKKKYISRIVLYGAMAAMALFGPAGCGKEESGIQEPEVIKVSQEGTEEADAREEGGTESESAGDSHSIKGGQDNGSVSQAALSGLEGQIAEQSFQVALDGWGDVTFASFIPDEYPSENPDYGVTMHGDARFMLLSGEEAVYEFPGESQDNILSGATRWQQILAVAFTDYNEDGRTDILILQEYTDGEGTPYRSVRPYTQEEGEKEFRIDQLLLEQLRYHTDDMADVYEGIAAYRNGYAVCTDASTWEVERFAKRVKKAVLAGDYEGLASLCRYPVMVDGIYYEDKEKLLAANLLQNLPQAFVDELAAEPCELLFCNVQGIMIGNGRIWFGEVTGEAGAPKELAIISFNIISDNMEGTNARTGENDVAEDAMMELLQERMPYYQANAYYDEMLSYWEKTRGVTDIASRTEPLYETDKIYLAKENLAYEPPLVIHLAKNEIYARHGYIFQDKDLYNYFMGCVWYQPTTKPEDFRDDVLNEYEKENLALLGSLDTM